MKKSSATINIVLISFHSARHLCASVVLAIMAMPALAVSPIFEENFDQSGQSVELLNGATLGESGSGVSGKQGDASYQAAMPPEGSPGPLAKMTGGLPTNPFQEITVTSWYKFADVPLTKGASLINTHGIVVYFEKDRWVLRINGAEGSKYYASVPEFAFSPGTWKFLAVTWTPASNTATFYAGDTSTPVGMVSESKRNDNPQELTFGEDKFIKAIGNTFVREADGTFPGNIDDFRIYDKALDAGQLEKIRQADVQNSHLDLN